MRDKQAAPETGRGEKKPNLFFRFLAFLVTLALVLGAVTLVVYRDQINLDAIKRWFSYRTMEKNDSGQAGSFSYEGASKDIFVSMGENLLVCSSAGIRLYSGSGVEYVSRQTALERPVAQSAGNWSVAYDAGGRSLFLFRGKEEAFSLTLDAGKTLLSARVNSAGWLAVTTQAAGYKGSVMVYDPEHAPVLQLNRSSSFIMDALVTEDGKYLAAATAGQNGAVFASSLDFYRLDRTQDDSAPDASSSLDGNIPLDLREKNQVMWALGESGVFAVSLSDSHVGEALGSYPYGGQYLKEFSLEGDGFAALLLGKYRAGSQAQLITVDPAGTQKGSLALNEQVLSLSAAGRYLAVLTADRLDIYTSDFQLYNTLSGTQGARKVLMRSDGTAMLIAGETARLYIPG